MHMTRRLLLASPFVVAATAITPAAAEDYKMKTPIAPGVASPDFLETSIGLLRLEDGVPTEWSADKIYDTLDRSRALQAYLLGIPIVNQVSMRNTLKEYGPNNTADVIWEDLVDCKTVELTVNDDVVHGFIWLDTKDGPLALERGLQHPAVSPIA